MESENLELNQQVGELGRALGQEAAAYQAQVLMMVIVVIVMLPSISMWSDARWQLRGGVYYGADDDADADIHVCKHKVLLKLMLLTRPMQRWRQRSRS